MKYHYLNEVSIIRQKLSEPDSLESYLKGVLIDANVTNEKRQKSVNLLVNEGWNRRMFYDLCMYINHNEDLPEEQHDLIREFMDDLSEFRSLANLVMVEIAGETPKEKADFMGFIYSHKWYEESED
ncbi:hypothetical protein GO755_07750 [Spirosoma sp. HMF4905]|uniref:Uncharacterized protein n=1 Tax=Spirosoma arboris TaxID=2682092 RepID=A0A7K1S7W2_9BACT|nr:hypothetical protein [Spirosoma arboris]MVM29921.1 hypothetical protein [Spirosoma arboris]